MKNSSNISGPELAEALRTLAYQPIRIFGSHFRLCTSLNGHFNITIPNHQPLKTGTLKSLLKSIAGHHGIPVKKLLEYLRIESQRPHLDADHGTGIIIRMTKKDMVSA